MSAPPINWNDFRSKNDNVREAFEDLCYFLFCRKYDLGEGVRSYKNQVGLETDPVHVEGKWRGFQCKFTDGVIDWSEWTDSLKKAKIKNPQLEWIRLYSNVSFSESSLPNIKLSIDAQKLESLADSLGVEIDWFGPRQFTVVMNHVDSIALARMYFGRSDTLNFIASSINPAIETLLQSSEFIPLRFSRNGTIVSRLITSLNQSQEKTFLLLGHPGSGKSISLHWLFRSFAGLTKKTRAQVYKHLLKIGAVPLLIDLKDCVNRDLPLIVRDRLQDSDIDPKDIKITYLLDGLDELSEERATHVLNYLSQLVLDDSTDKIILSCRSGNPNRHIIPSYIPRIVHIELEDLNSKDIELYFQKRDSGSRLESLHALQKSNPRLVSDVKDILLVKLMWETISRLTDGSTIVDLIELSVDQLLRAPAHRKNLDTLNLPNDKSEALLQVNLELSFKFQQKYQYRFTRLELQEVILKLFPKLDYRSSNEILNYLVALFFNTTHDSSGTLDSYIYRHRKYQDYFYVERLQAVYESDPSILRKHNILAHRDIFEQQFLPTLRQSYRERGFLVGLLDLNLLDVYLGKHRGWGAEEPYYHESSNFICSLAEQSPALVDELLDSETFNLRNSLLVETSDLRKLAEEFENTQDREVGDRLGVKYSAIATILAHSEAFWRAGNRDLAKALNDNWQSIQKIFSERRMLKKLKDHRIGDPYWESLESYIFFLLTVQGSSPLSVLEKIIRPHLSKVRSSFHSFEREKGEDKLYGSFFRVVLSESLETFSTLISDLNDYEFAKALQVLCAVDYIGIYCSSTNLQETVTRELRTRQIVLERETCHIGLFLRLSDIPLQDSEHELIRLEAENMREEASNSWMGNLYPHKYAVLVNALGRSGLEDMQVQTATGFEYFNDLLAYSAIYDGLIDVARGRVGVGRVVRIYVEYSKTCTRYRMSPADTLHSNVWARIFAYGRIDEGSNARILVSKLIKAKPKLDLLEFYLLLANLNEPLFLRLVEIGNLIHSKPNIRSDETFSSSVDCSFKLSRIWAHLDEKKGRSHFIRGLKDSILRHGWRKDTIVSYDLVEAFKVLWINKWEGKRKLKRLANEIFEMAVLVTAFTDGKFTWRGPYNVIDFVAQHDLRLAKSLKRKLSKHKSFDELSSAAATSIAIGLVKAGEAISSVEDAMGEIYAKYTRDGSRTSEYYQRRAGVYVTIAESEWYTSEEREEAFTKALSEVQQLIQVGHKAELRVDWIYELDNRYNVLCDKYATKRHLLREKQHSLKGWKRKRDVALVEIEGLSSPKAIRGFFKRLSNGRNGMLIRDFSVWSLLLNKTYEVFGNIQLFTTLLYKHYYPHMEVWTDNSNNYHFGVAVAISDSRMRTEMLDYLSAESGHGGFLNMIKVYETLGDKDMCRRLFNRFLKLCHFLCE